MSITHPCSQWNLQIKLPARGKIIVSCQPNMSPKHYIKLYKQQKWTLKKSRLTSFKKCIFHAPQLPPQLLVGVGTELGGGGGWGCHPSLSLTKYFVFHSSEQGRFLLLSVGIFQTGATRTGQLMSWSSPIERVYILLPFFFFFSYLHVTYYVRVF